jgi:hypothetical protein
MDEHELIIECPICLKSNKYYIKIPEIDNEVKEIRDDFGCKDCGTELSITLNVEVWDNS